MLIFFHLLEIQCHFWMYELLLLNQVCSWNDQRTAPSSALSYTLKDKILSMELITFWFVLWLLFPDEKKTNQPVDEMLLLPRINVFDFLSNPCREWCACSILFLIKWIVIKSFRFTQVCYVISTSPKNAIRIHGLWRPLVVRPHIALPILAADCPDLAWQ